MRHLMKLVTAARQSTPIMEPIIRTTLLTHRWLPGARYPRSLYGGCSNHCCGLKESSNPGWSGLQ